ncbi:MAG: hypothetical protein ACMUHB_05565 [Thermoplasmatota archaeon]
MVMIISSFMFITAPGEVSAHAPESMVLSYDYNSRNLTVTITHTTPLPDQHYIESVEVFRNEISIIQETYTSQPELRTFSLYFDVIAEDGDVLNVTAVCNVFGSLTEEIDVEGPKARMDLSVSPAITLIEMGEEQSFTVNIYNNEDGMPVDGVTVTASAVLGEVTEVSALGLGGYEFTYTAPELDDEDIEVINITAQMNGYHSAYHEFDLDIVFPVDPAKKIAVTITPAFTTINENEAKELTVKVTAGGSDLDVDGITVTRSGGVVSTDKTGTGTFMVTFKASEVQRDTMGWINVVAEKEGYQRGEKRMSFTIRDSSGPVDDDDDDDTSDDDIAVSNEKDFLNGTTITIFLVILVLIGGIVGFIIYRKRKKEE